ncbi:MAG: sugar ABC transporter permease, partial [Clostridiales bacterium]|nr:sugar ABC transporter permease [Clostridiales bacterium]
MDNVADTKVKVIKKEKNISTTIFVYALIIWPLIHFAIFWVYLNIETIVLTFQSFSINSGQYKFVGLQNYQDLWKWVFERSPSDMMVYAIKNSISILIWVMCVMTPISMIFGYTIYKKVPLGNFFKVIFFVPNIISSVVMVALFKLMFDPNIGMIGYVLELLQMQHVVPVGGFFGDGDIAWTMILIECLWAGIGYDMIIFMSGYNRIPPEVSESAKMDGAGFFREFVSISLPMISTTLSTKLILSSTTGLGFFMNALLLTNGGPGGQTHTLMMVIVNQTKGGQQGVTMAATVGVMFSVICLPFIYLFRKV